jgi:hypothetical protein
MVEPLAQLGAADQAARNPVIRDLESITGKWRFNGVFVI